MSYAIEYNRQFIKSRSGITPCWLAGDNNVTTFACKGRERRARDWGIFHNLLGVTEQEILEAVKPSLGGDQEHWRKNGKWVDDAGLIRWVKNGCKAAATIEEILLANRSCGGSIHCYASVWTRGLENTRTISTYVRTTEEFDAWIELARAEREKSKANGCYFYPVVDFVVEDLKHPNNKPKTELPDNVLLRRGSGTSIRYLSALHENGSEWSGNVKSAMVFTKDEAARIQRDRQISDSWVASSTLVDAAAKDYPFNVVIRFSDGIYSGEFVAKKTRKNIRLTQNISNAKHYRNASAAKAALKALQPICQRYGALEVVPDPAVV